MFCSPNTRSVKPKKYENCLVNELRLLIVMVMLLTFHTEESKNRFMSLGKETIGKFSAAV